MSVPGCVNKVQSEPLRRAGPYGANGVVLSVVRNVELSNRRRRHTPAGSSTVSSLENSQQSDRKDNFRSRPTAALSRGVWRSSQALPKARESAPFLDYGEAVRFRPLSQV